MQDKKENYEKIELNEMEATTRFKDRVFPTRIKGMNTILSVVIGSKKACYVCVDTPNPGGAILHVYIPGLYRQKVIINKLIEIFYSHVHPWCKARGITSLITSCSVEDTKTTELIKSFGFKPEAINLAIMEVR